MKIAFICAPYRAKTDNERHWNIERARMIAESAWRAGYAVICPHTNSAWFSGVVDEDAFLKGYEAILAKCDVLFVEKYMPITDGMKAEIETAKSLGIEIVWVTPSVRVDATA